MRRSRWVRLVAAWLACWLPLVLADGGWLHACPMHDGVGVTAAGSTMAAPASELPPHARAVTHASHDAHHGRHFATHVCTCLGACCAALAVLPAELGSVPIAALERAYVAPTGRPEYEYVAAWVDFVLPFATAPPSQG